ncbi:hypothetical protein [Paenarthrobacter ureafaciens]|uniref:hypothetical protein n=1 Tax=Paenarthrobacter ureafaciens TaxID=37931 RepID=UPI002DB845BB|nr:hypothetical protein [Paenarthrobacter ureafaciens]MEC3853603.1 hypothetical protein [Paenarthrobacter ureafaciens]
MTARWAGPVIVGFAVSIGTGLGACSAPAAEPSLVSASLQPKLRLVTVESHQDSAMDAAFTGTLSVDANGCVYAHPGGIESDVYTLVWPQGYSTQGDGKAFDVVDADKHPVVRSGSEVELGGGHVNAPRDNWTEKDCAKGTLRLVAPPDFSQVSRPSGG